MVGQNALPIDNISVQHAGTEHLAVRNTILNRFLTLLALKTTARFFQRHGPCSPISQNLVVKTGKFVHLTEAATLRFIRSNTTIPVPRVHCSFIHDNQAYIAMERIRGETIADAWPSLSTSDLESLFAQLRHILKEMRSLRPFGTGVRSCTGSSFRDSRIPRSKPRFGPFETIHELHVWLRDGFQLEQHQGRDRDRQRQRQLDDQDWTEIQDMISKQDGPWPPPIFTHGDLNPFNILVRGAQVVGIIDWEFSGWYPYYWEYTSTWHGNKTRQAWQDVIPKFLDPDPECLKMETIRQRWWGDF
ncbi:hypothetical protein B0A52_03891 [Exophiala mesophila]|uniref:Aminoglycoside phosphotransferase domain-containing protein n=1 Tax=Exophiala mesophila TaxID=212818 RepID=A0A438N7G1_EXOME|nr:hypothetical protein B0A52_03891 [Exophiala mesophila]